MSTAPKHWKKKYDARRPERKRKAARTKLRRERLSVPITPADVARFVRHLIAVPFVDGQECWLYVGCGKGTTLPEDIKFKPPTYAQLSFHGEKVGPHQFALAAAEGITLAELKGYDVHHIGSCFGYRCCNPDHLEKIVSPEHRGTGFGGCTATAFKRQVVMVQEVLTVPKEARKVAERQTVTGAASKREVLAGIPFLIRTGQWMGLEDMDSCISL